MARKKLPEQARLKQLLDYDPETGLLFWRERDESSFEGFGGQNKSNASKAKTWNTLRAGQPAMDIATGYHGYLMGGIDLKCYFTHRIIWKWWHGTEPDMIDHANGKRRDNRIENLRPTTYQKNAMNAGISRRNTSGRVGVKRSSSGKKWRATITLFGRLHQIGTYDTFEEASLARSEAEARAGFGPNHGAVRTMG